MESDESRIYNAAHLMVASLAGSLAHVTCKVSISCPKPWGFYLFHFMKNMLLVYLFSDVIFEVCKFIFLSFQWGLLIVSYYC